jgi:hypothetical protein
MADSLIDQANDRILKLVLRQRTIIYRLTVELS